MTTVHHSPPPGAAPFAIYEETEDQEPPSPSEVYEGDASFNSEMSLPGVDEAIPSIEHEEDAEDEPRRYSTSYTSRPSHRSNSVSRVVSGVTTTSFVSSLPSESSVASKPILPANNLDSRYSPRKERPPFRNPASVRAMQMASPPPLPALEASRERLKGNYKLATPSRDSRSDSLSTSGSRRHRPHREATPTPQQFPLVLLHVTILPMQMPYSHDMMVRVVPEWLAENYRVLEEKLQDIILMRRGLLIPHPRDEYEVLEERILESLELKVPRLLNCGHFVGPDEDEEEHEDHIIEERRVSITDDGTGTGTGRGSRMSGGTITAEEEAEWKYPTPEADDASVCIDCHRQVKKPGRGCGVGTKRWDIKIYAANGLMRAGAWLAAWTEMERCDVEISPWIPEEVRKSLDKRVAEEQEAAQRKQMYAAELQRRIEEETARRMQLEGEAELQRRAEEIQAQTRAEMEAAALRRKLEEGAVETRRLEETLDEKIEEAKETMRLEFEAQAMAEASSFAERLRAMEDTLKMGQEKAAPTQAQRILDTPPVERHTRSPSQDMLRPSSREPKPVDVPLGTLLKNYLLLLLRDSRNYLLVILTALVVYLAINKNNHSLPVLSAVPFEEHTSHDISSVITSTQMMTATSGAALAVSELPLVESNHESLESLPPAYEASNEIGIAASSSSIDEPHVSASLNTPSHTQVASSSTTTVASTDPEGTETFLAMHLATAVPEQSEGVENTPLISEPEGASPESAAFDMLSGLTESVQENAPSSEVGSDVRDEL